MTVTVNRPAKSINDVVLDALDGFDPSLPVTFWSIGDSAETDFDLESGWTPNQVYVDGALMKPGSGDDYTVTSDGFKHTVVFAVAPGAVNIGIIAYRIQT